ncbi:penicillin-binding protein 2 [Acetobacteraceae bacterium]|nr:penicillin-binding protein 2 [Acetobacteraceae bacterium]
MTKKPYSTSPLFLEKKRLLGVSCAFLTIFSVLSLKTAWISLFYPLPPPSETKINPPDSSLDNDPSSAVSSLNLPHIQRASVTDRNGQTLAASLPVVSLYAHPDELIEIKTVVRQLKEILPNLDVKKTIYHLENNRKFAYIARNLTPKEEVKVNNLGIPGLYFENSEKRHYPLGHVAAHVIGGVDIDDHGISGIEKYFDERLLTDRTPLRLSLDVRVQEVVRSTLIEAIHNFNALGGCAIVMDIHTGEIIAMVSAPDFDANNLSKTPMDVRFNRAVTGAYEPGSTLKLQTAAMALQSGKVHIWDRFSTSPIHIGRFKISDLSTDHFAPYLSFPEVLAHSSNPGAAHIALDVGEAAQQEWFQKIGFLSRVPIELPEAARPLFPPPERWKTTTVLTVGFGHGIAEPPLSILRGVSTLANGGILVTPTLIPLKDKPNASQPIRVMSQKTSDILRKIMRLDITQGTGRKAEALGYYPGGKTGTAEKIDAHGRYMKHTNITAFAGAFPMNDPKYSVYIMLDAPQGNESTHGYQTAGWIAAPVFSKIVLRIAPMLGIYPNFTDTDQIEQSLSIPMQPSAPQGVRALGPGYDPGENRLELESSKKNHNH